MSATIAFEKWEGLGNDFVVVRAEPSWSNDLVQRVCDRRRGVGADGVLFVSTQADGLPTMTVRNADGSRPEMCGNGLRCVAASLLSSGAGATLMVATDAGERQANVTRTGKNGFDVTIGMGVVRAGPGIEVDFEGRPFSFAQADVGNPHAVTFDPWDDALVDRLGPHVERLPASRTNVEFCRHTKGSSRIDVVVWERGVGRTLACGTGACAVAAVAADTGHVPFDSEVEVALPGGSLFVRVGRERREATMRGPARRVFRGELEVP